MNERCVEPTRECPFSEEVFAARLREIEQQVEKSNTLVRWGIGIIVTVGITLGSMVYGTVDGRIEEIERVGSPAMRERAARVEQEMAGVRESLAEIKAGQRLILEKLERAAERESERNTGARR